jgi:hypothetical protein
MMMNRKEKELRDWYAGLAMQAIIMGRKSIGNPYFHAKDAFDMAEAMMDRRQDVMTAEMYAEIGLKTE